MFNFVQKYSTASKVILGLIGLTFVVAGGVAGTGAISSDNYLVKVGDQEVTLDKVRDVLRQQQGDITDQVQKDILQALTQEAYLFAGAQQMGVTVSDEQLKKIIMAQSIFQQDGTFQEKLYQDYLRNNGLKEEQFLEGLRKDFSLQTVLNLIQSSQIMADSQLNQAIQLFEAPRTIRTMTFSPEQFASKVDTSDAALKAYYDAHQKDFIQTQGLKFNFLVLSGNEVLSQLKVTDEEAKAYFDKNQASLPEKRRVAHILLAFEQGADEASKAQTKKKAEALLAKVKAKPADFAALAKENSQDPGSAQNGGDLGFFAKDGTMVKPFEDASFGLKKDEISGLVETEFGYHILKVLEVGQTFDSQKNQIIDTLRQEKIKAAVDAKKKQLIDAAIKHGDDLNAVAKATGLASQPVGEWVTAEQAKQAQMPEALQKVLFDAKTIADKKVTEPIDVGQNTYWVVQVTDVRPEKQLSLEEAKAQVKQAHTVAEANKLAQAAAKEALDKLQKGESATVTWSPAAEMSPQQAQQTMPPEAYRQLIAVRPSEGKPQYVLLEGLPAPVLVAVDKIGTVEAKPEMLQQMQGLLGKNQNDGALMGYIQYLQTQFPAQKGTQELTSAQ
ncbi:MULTISPECIES: peptidylprolyl isomerase [Vitreoscilla]|uniref:Periplasmic chaperone PpiD n=1 Tax=Vitreoscilla stercoraria TaxID=61 RepID=A0ABY4E841_VITST|nr:MULTISPECIES: peptidylprolyl isomerase [Vitreoscilla]AUZ04335.2 PpiC-type peptidyl-prolyl cis-trans isomerase [Vitreoscilla sp. C1]UOO91931.1 peptidylprolyl isomerase [Vitreoscilla stercoraria]